ncbi:KRAB-A domain-containing protein 2 [Trichosurus vulpecula]|uniref:KRAB-A domain-containing protein 2 n=1 Tax=Trichosurus vulpecula TaxID=9337 RepID=UPI00186AD72C|nr:KRAB-A domain-containing protein 2 [Trichosurus vulpecula]
MMSQSVGDGKSSDLSVSKVESEMRSMREKFLARVTKLVESKSYNSKVFSKEKYFQTLREVKEAKEKGKKSSRDYRRVAKYDVITIHGTEKLIEAAHGQQDRIRYYVHKEELFDILHDTHLSIGHGGRTRMLKELQGKYGNVTKEVIVLYLSLCKQCHQKNPVPKRGLVAKPMTFKVVCSRCQVDFIDMQSNADGEFRFILSYLDYLTKFIILRPLKSQRAHEVACVLLDIFSIIGAPSVLESDSSREFVNHVLSELNQMWPELKIIHEKPQNSQSQGMIEEVNQEVQQLMSTWMQSNNSPHWAEGLRFVQMMKNQAICAGLQQSPYEAMFGCKPKFGLYNSNLPRETVSILHTEEELEIAEEQLENNLMVKQEEGPEIGAEKSDIEEDIDTNPTEMPEPCTSQTTTKLICH